MAEGVEDVALGSSMVVAPAVAGFEIALKVGLCSPRDVASVISEVGVVSTIVTSIVGVGSRLSRSGLRVHVV